jgi:hypothetical protein
VYHFLFGRASNWASSLLAVNNKKKKKKKKKKSKKLLGGRIQLFINMVEKNLCIK